MKTKYAVQFAGQTFTRTTARTYSHIVVAKRDANTAMRWAERNGEQYVNEVQAKINDGVYDKYQLQGFCGDFYLAQKLAGSLGSAWTDAQIVAI